MKAPSSLDYRLARRGTGPALLLGALGTFYLWGNDPRLEASVPVLFPLVLFAVLGRSARVARHRVSAFNQWNRAWHDMGGDAPEDEPQVQREPAPRAQQRRTQAPRTDAKRKRIAREWLGVLSWCALAWWLSQQPADTASPDYLFAEVAFAALTLAGVVIAVITPLRWLRQLRTGTTARVRSSRREREDVVTIVPSVPRSAPTLRDTYAALPDYCRALMARPTPNPVR
jgi:hypothetical protein